MHFLFGLILVAALPFACGERPARGMDGTARVDPELSQRAP